MLLRGLSTTSNPSGETNIQQSLTYGDATGNASPRSSEFNPAIRKIIYTTNAVESLNYQLR